MDITVSYTFAPYSEGILNCTCVCKEGRNNELSTNTRILMIYSYSYYALKLGESVITGLDWTTGVTFDLKNQ